MMEKGFETAGCLNKYTYIYINMWGYFATVYQYCNYGSVANFRRQVNSEFLREMGAGEEKHEHIRVTIVNPKGYYSS